MQLTNILWDWNGTLLNDAPLGLIAMNETLEHFNLPPLRDLKHYREVFGFPVKDYYERAGLIDIPFKECADYWVTRYYARDAECPLQESAIEALDAFRALGLKQSILSAQEAGLLRAQTGRFPIGQYFDELLGLSNVYAGSKVRLGIDWIERTGASAEQTLFIGDTLHDFDVSRAIGCRCVLMSFGHQSKEKLLSAGCPVLDDFSDLTAMIRRELA